MMLFEWNALRVGDKVRFHRNGGALASGTVAFLNVLPGSNGVGVRYTSAESDDVSWPSRLSVHPAVGDTDDPGAPCLRCAALRSEHA